MDFKELPKFEQIRGNREKLLLLEKEGKYVFHGSPDQIKILIPRQAEQVNKETGKMEKSGDPAVFATQYADIAIFRALINKKNIIRNSESGFGIDGDNLHFSVTKNLLDAVKKKIGRVYVLDRQKFKDFDGMQCQSTESVAPLEIIEVNINDLPKNIKILE